MADTKITALTALTAADPANDVIPIVDVSDTSMAASGTTKKISVNNILGASGTATLASATITGDLTVDTSTLKVDSTNNRVGIGTASPGNALHVQSSGDVARFTNGTNNAYLAIDSAGYTLFTGAGQTGNGIYAKASTNAVQLWTNGAQRYDIDSTGVATWSVAGTTAMTLNSTGLGVKGTVGTASGDAVIAFGTRGVIVGNAASAIASASYIDITVVTGGEGYQGFLSVANTWDASANVRTQTTYSVFGRGTPSTITQIATANGSSGGASFTVTTPSNGVIRITNTSGLAATISAQFFGGTSL